MIHTILANAHDHFTGPWGLPYLILPGWGILVDLEPEMTVEEFRQGKR